MRLNKKERLKRLSLSLDYMPEEDLSMLATSLFGVNLGQLKKELGNMTRNQLQNLIEEDLAEKYIHIKG